MPTRSVERHRPSWVVVAMALAVIALPIDSFGLVVALPSIGSEFSATTSALAWVLNIAMFLFGAGVLVLGRISDVFGRRRVILVSMAVMAIGSVGCALAPSIGVLIALRVVEGAGMSGIYAASFPIVNDAFPPERRAMGLGLWAGGFMLGTVIGPIMAGEFSQHLSWRWIFWINLPLLAAAAGLTLVAVRESRDEGASRAIDWFGVVVPSAAILCLLFGLQSASALGWGSPAVVATLIAAPVLLVVFVGFEPRRKHPLIDLRLFARRAYLGATGVAFAGNIAFGAVLFFAPMYLQVALGYSPTHAGTVLLAISIPAFVGSVAAGPVCSRYGTKPAMAVGMVLLTIGCVLFAFIDLVPGSGLTPRQLHDIHGVLAGSPAARRGLLRDAPAVASHLEAVIRDVYLGGLRWAMLVIAVIGVLGTTAAFVTDRPGPEGTSSPRPPV